jgi:uracil-DNA glycosylase family 4
VHHFPGRRSRGSGDLKPPDEEIARNRRWLEAEVRLLAPAIVIALGQQPAAVLLERYSGKRIRRLIDVAGVPLHCHIAGVDVQVIAVHHPSGAFQHSASGEAYKRAASHIRRVLRTAVARAGARPA